MDKRDEFNAETIAALLEVEEMKRNPEKYKTYNDVDEMFEDALKEEDMEIPPSLLANLIEWMRNKGISDEDIVDFMLYICKENKAS